MPSHVYVSLPLTGPAADLGRDVLRGAELAFEGAAPPEVELVALDAYGPDRDKQAEANARIAADDDSALAYLGDFHSSQVARSAAVLEEARLLCVAPAATWIELGGSTLVRLTPHDGALARAIAAWLSEASVRDLLVVHDHDEGYGVSVGVMCAEAARRRGLDVRSRPVWDKDERLADDFNGAQAVLYVGVAGSGAVGLWRALHEADPTLWLLATDGAAVPWLARELSGEAAAQTRFFTAQRAPLAFYGYEGMALVLDAIAAEGPDRDAIVRAARGTHDRESIIGRYSLDGDGHTTAPADGRLAVIDARIAWDR
ncbi:MAG: branched-chain amino acid transport system substrate-binding protein [Solirubrobacteraceae bacterium]